MVKLCTNQKHTELFKSLVKAKGQLPQKFVKQVKFTMISIFRLTRQKWQLWIPSLLRFIANGLKVLTLAIDKWLNIKVCKIQMEVSNGIILMDLQN